MTSFSDLGLAEPVLRALADEGYETPTPIQAQAIPQLIAGRDLLGTAQTGTGKTAAFVLPILHALAAVQPRQRTTPKCATALILAPTRELAAQIAESVRTYGRHIRPYTATVVGGVKPGPQIRSLSRGVDILVATPGRLLDHFGSGALRLDQVRMIVLDEADQMMDLGFLPAIRKILAALPKDRQTALLSATMPNQIRALAHDFLTDPAQISVAAVSRPIERIEQSLVRVAQGTKPDALVKLLGSAGGRTIVFTRTKRGADKVAKKLEQARIPSAAIHGNKSQSQRTRALDAFKSQRPPVLVATDIAARGIDIDDVQLVVNFDLPNVPESYVHRIGRTARAGASGEAVSFCDGEEFKLLREIERLIGYRIEARELEGVETLPAPAQAEGKPRQNRNQNRSQNRGGGKPSRRPANGHNQSQNRGAHRGQAAPQHGASAGGHGPDARSGEAQISSPTRPSRPPHQPNPAHAGPAGRSAQSKSGDLAGSRPAKPGRSQGDMNGGKPAGKPGGKFAGKFAGKPDGKLGGKLGGKPGGKPGFKSGGKPHSDNRPHGQRKGRESEAAAAHALARLMEEAETAEQRRPRHGGKLRRKPRSAA